MSAARQWTYEVHELSSGYSAVVYNEHGLMVADHLDEPTSHLIAAAPELYEACRYIVEAAENGDEQTAVELASAALRKARERSA